jgi:hypothetical protein
VSNGRQPVFAVQLDRFDDQVNGIDAVDLASRAVGFAWYGAEAFGEVQQAIHTPGVVIEHEQQSTRTVFRPREQESSALSEIIAILSLRQANEFRICFS